MGALLMRWSRVRIAHDPPQSNFKSSCYRDLNIFSVVQLLLCYILAVLSTLKIAHLRKSSQNIKN